MTSRAHAPTVEDIPAAGYPGALAAPWGVYTRYMLAAYLRHAGIVTFGLLVVALTIDLSPWLTQVMEAKPEATGIWALLHLGRFLLLRSADLGAQLLPVGCFLGVFWCEVAHTWSRERLVIWNSGRSPLQCLIPILAFGALTGVVQVVVETYLRPMAIEAQIAGRLGDQGVKFDRSPTADRRWIAAGHDLVHARIAYGPPPALYDVTIYRFDPEGRLTEVLGAPSATPGAKPSTWVLHGRQTSAGDRSTGVAPGGSPLEAGRSATVGGEPEKEILLSVNPIWLSYHGIAPRYLRPKVLGALARGADSDYPTSDYRTSLQVRRAQALLPGGMALLATSLSLLLLGYRNRTEALLGIALAGYSGHVAMRAFVLLGEQGYLPPVVAAWFTPLALLAASAAALWIVQAQNVRAGRL